MVNGCGVVEKGVQQRRGADETEWIADDGSL